MERSPAGVESVHELALVIDEYAKGLTKRYGLFRERRIPIEELRNPESKLLYNFFAEQFHRFSERVGYAGSHIGDPPHIRRDSYLRYSSPYGGASMEFMYVHDRPVYSLQIRNGGTRGTINTVSTNYTASRLEHEDWETIPTCHVDVTSTSNFRIGPISAELATEIISTLGQIEPIEPY